MDCMRNHFTDGVLLDGRYTTICPLNHGSFGLVFKAQDVITGDQVALKCLTKPAAAAKVASSVSVDDRSEELAIHRLIGNHPNIVNLLNHFETEHHVYLVLEYCQNGDLYEAIRIGRGPGQTDNIRESMLQLIDAVEHMHQNGVYHRDIKPENIFLSQTGTVKLGDFGLATKDDISFESAVGSDRYMAPEQMDPSEGGYSPAKADVWAIGICLLNILFSRNPFATPTLSDPLFADFASDRQTLFDVFPNMSQDTFDVLVHCLAMDPANRSLELAKEAIMRAISFTTDDESLDEFCAAPVVIATANREPLRTPSISSPQIDQGGAFPWAKALAMTDSARQLSTVFDDIEFDDAIFPSSLSKPVYTTEQNNSLVSFVDSGLGLSVKSSNMSLDPVKTGGSKPVPISGSLPATAARPISSLAAIFGKKGDYQSKSWSDIWDEDFEEENAAHAQAEQDVDDFFRRTSMDSLASSSNGSDTPRVGLAELVNPEAVNNSRVRTPEHNNADNQVSEHTGFLFEDLNESMAVQTPGPLSADKYSPPSKRSILDKWSALGDRRRAPDAPFKDTPTKAESRDATEAFSLTLTTPPNKRSRPTPPHKGINWNLWGQAAPRTLTTGLGAFSPETKKQWSKSKDWRHEKSFHGAMEADRGRPFEWVWRTDSPHRVF
ncbi:kinase-like protein [Microthyrium microscopicum]|uniref:Kinase-like protein n=1 Tax=Microthyrium microscopicum TaxID=703497 RepID=A0A6A6UIN8_9PEZI|nr:kinase-like protein [Microthyrium microscopicum]